MDNQLDLFAGKKPIPDQLLNQGLAYQVYYTLDRLERTQAIFEVFLGPVPFETLPHDSLMPSDVYLRIASALKQGQTVFT